MVQQKLLGHEKAGTWDYYKNMGRKPVPDGLESWRCAPSAATGTYEVIEVAVPVRVLEGKPAPNDPEEVDDDLYETLQNERKSYESPMYPDQRLKPTTGLHPLLCCSHVLAS